MKVCIRKMVPAVLLLFALSAGAAACGGQAGQSLSLVSEETAAVQMESPEETQEQETSAETQSLKETADCMAVYICGAVASPGVYEVAQDMRLVDLVELAGGFAADADEMYWNLAQKISDGAMYYIPTLSETAREDFALPGGSGDSGAGAAPSGEAADGGETGDGPAADAGSDGLVSINTATQEELTALPGIGATKAAAIITYRETNGPFAAIDEIMNVTGIGESTYEKLKDYICL